MEQKEINKITSEILIIKQQLAQNIIKIGRKQLGDKATLKQIASYVAPMFEMESNDCFEIISNLKVVK